MFKHLRIIVAHTTAGGIGYNGTIPWHISEDLRRFKQLTNGNIVVMGRKTYESIPVKFRPLPCRINIVMTSNPKESVEGQLYYCNSFESICDQIKKIQSTYGDKYVDIIGGADIYNQWLPYTQIIEVTKVIGSYECDRSFPDYTNEFQMVWNTEPTISESGTMYQYERWIRKGGE
jgi:dihydrofolate reductase